MPIGGFSESSKKSSKHELTEEDRTLLWGKSPAIAEVAMLPAIYYIKTPPAHEDHSLVTAPGDQSGTIRVQYREVRVIPDELLIDIKSLMQERAR